MPRHLERWALLLALAATALAAPLPSGLYTIKLDGGREACADRNGYLSALPPAAALQIMLAQVVAPDGLQLWRLGDPGQPDITGLPVAVQVRRRRCWDTGERELAVPAALTAPSFSPLVCFPLAERRPRQAGGQPLLDGCSGRAPRLPRRAHRPAVGGAALVGGRTVEGDAGAGPARQVLHRAQRQRRHVRAAPGCSTIRACLSTVHSRLAAHPVPPPLPPSSPPSAAAPTSSWACPAPAPS